MKQRHDAGSSAAGAPESRSAESSHGGSEQGLRVLSYLIAGMLFYGALGWLGDRAFETRFLMPIGIVVGMALAIFMIIRRFGGLGQKEAPQDSRTSGRQAQSNWQEQ